MQRAVLLLRDVFDYGYGEIADIVGRSEANVRQLAVRARRHVAEQRPRFEASREQREELARRFFAATQDGDLGALEALLAHDVELHGDGGGKVPALARALRGRGRVARALVAWARVGRRDPGARMQAVEINGQPGALVLDGSGAVLGAMALDIEGGRVRAVRSVVNPDKLGHLGQVGDMRALLGRPKMEGRS